nr:SufD family Fe-S cluster assembly protein [Sphingomonas quercus]
MDLPSTHDEAWRWSDLSGLPALAGARPGGRAPTGELWIGCGGPRLLFIDGAYRPEESDPGPVTVGPAEAGAGDHPLGRLAGHQGWRLQLARDRGPAATIEIVHVATGGPAHVAAEIVMDEDAQASLVETFAGEGWHNVARKITLGRAARLGIARRVLGGGFASLTDTASLAAGASLDIATLAAGSGDSRLDTRLTLEGGGAYGEAGGALLARGAQRHDANAVLRHAAAGGTSRQLWRSVADDRATCAVAARVEVARDAQKTDAEQSLKGLLLARTATINAKPELEIFADDVKCAHGATVGELDRNALFYLASRGVPPVEAKALLTRAFVADALARIGDEAVRAAFLADAEAWLGA